MSNWTLGLVVLLLALSVGLALTNPTMPDYLAFLDRQLGRALEQGPQGRSGMLGAWFATEGRRVLDALIRPNTTRRNYGFFSLFETTLLEERVLVLGIGNKFFPLQGVESVRKKVEALTVQPSR